MTHEEAITAFEHLGGSWKHSTTTSKHQIRLLHGQNGQGRYFAFDLGTFIEWQTVANAKGGLELTKIQIEYDDLREPVISDPAPTDKPTGTRVTIENVSEQASAALQRGCVASGLCR